MIIAEKTVKFNNIPKFVASLEAELNAVVLQTANRILEEVQRTVPVLTGALRDSYFVEIVGLLEATVRSNLNYAAFVELGTSRMAPHPSVYPAYVAAMPQFAEDCRRAIERAAA